MALLGMERIADADEGATLGTTKKNLLIEFTGPVRLITSLWHCKLMPTCQQLNQILT